MSTSIKFSISSDKEFSRITFHGFFHTSKGSGRPESLVWLVATPERSPANAIAITVLNWILVHVMYLSATIFTRSDFFTLKPIPVIPKVTLKGQR